MKKLPNEVPPAFCGRAYGCGGGEGFAGWTVVARGEGGAGLVLATPERGCPQRLQKAAPVEFACPQLMQKTVLWLLSLD
jgi:hypothetical protein